MTGRSGTSSWDNSCSASRSDGSVIFRLLHLAIDPLRSAITLEFEFMVFFRLAIAVWEGVSRNNIGVSSHDDGDDDDNDGLAVWRVRCV